jgi:hypothetical protein
VNPEAEAQERDAAQAIARTLTNLEEIIQAQARDDAHDQAQAYSEIMERSTASFQLNVRACKAQEREEAEAEE